MPFRMTFQKQFICAQPFGDSLGVVQPVNRQYRLLLDQFTPDCIRFLAHFSQTGRTMVPLKINADGKGVDLDFPSLHHQAADLMLIAGQA